MERKYILVFFDWIEVTAELSAEEKGRLVDALVLLARGEDWKSRVQGNERFVFPFLRNAVERSLERSAARAAAGAKGGKQAKRDRVEAENGEADAENAKQTEANASKSGQGQARPTEEEEE